MIIAGVGLEQDVTMENVDMKTGPKTGTAGMAGSAASPHLLYFMILSVFRAVCGSIFGRLQAVGRYVWPPQGRRADRTSVLLLPTLCLALAFVFFNAAVAMAQECNPGDPCSTNVPPVAEAGEPQTVDSGATVQLEGSGTDMGGTIATYAWTRTGGTTGGMVTFSDATIARPTFTADTLAAGADDVTHILTLTVTDNDGASHADTVTITVEAPNANPVAEAGEPQTVDSGATVQLEGSGTDMGGTIATYAWTRTGGTIGGMVTFSDATIARPTFTADTLAAGADDVTHILTLTVTDNDGATHADTVTITVEAPNANPVAEAGEPQTVDSGATVQLEGSGTDMGGTIATYAWTRTGGTIGGMVTFSDATIARPTFTADTLAAGADDVTHILTLTVTDNDGATHADTVTITVEAPNANPVAEAGEPQTVDSGATVQLEGSGTDMGGTIATYAWTRTGGTTGGMVTFSDATIARPTFTADTLAAGADNVMHILTLTVTDNDGATHADTVTITVEAPNANPVAEAGEPQTVDSGATVQLEGSGTDMGGTIATYAWTRTGGTTGGMVTFSDATIARPTFTADTLAAGADNVMHILTLTVTDNDGATHADTVTITVEAPNANPVAEAGEPQTVDSGATVQLEGSGTDMGGTIATYAWTRTGGTIGGMVTFSDATIARPTFTADTLAAGADDVTHILTLTVTDNDGATHADTVTITVEAPNANPVAEAGEPQTVDSGATVQLEGSGTDMGGTIATYAWTRTGGTTGGMVTFSDATIARPTFTADTLAAGADNVMHILTLTVTDNDGATHADTVTITVEAPNANPVAEAGEPQTVDSGATVQLEGSGTDMGGTIATYAWTRTGGTTGGMVTFSDATIARPTFTADTLAAGADDVMHILTLTVTDNDGATHADTVTITVEAPNANPVAEAGEPQTVDSGATVQLEGSGTDMGGTIATYSWTRTGGTMGGMVTFSDATIARPTFTADTLAAGADDVTHILTLTVTDNDGASHADTVTITVEAPNADPVAEAGEPQTVDSGATVQLEGSGTDMGGTIATYSWTRTGGTMGGMVTFSDATIARPTFTADTLAAGADDVTHILTLTVTDNDGATHADTVTVTVTTAPVNIVLKPSDLKVQEGDSGTYRVRLSEAPRQEVIIMATSGNEGVVRLKNTRLVFNAGNWNDWQEVEVNAVADSVNNDDRIKVTITHSIDGVASKQLGTVTVTVRAQEDDPILDHVGQFIATRATALLGQQPDLIRFLKQGGPTAGDDGAFTFQATDGRLSLDGGFIHDGTWGEVTGARINSESSDTESVLASFGIHRKYSETFLAGAMLQFDLADRDLSQQAGTIDGTGWLVGPYFVARHGSQPLYFEGRLLYGQSDNDIRFIDPYLGVRTGSFDSARLLAQIRVEGEIAVPGHGDDGGADAPRLIPYADIRWVEDRAAAFTTVSATTGFRTPVLGQTVNISQLELGSNMVIPVAVRTGSMILTGGLGLVLSNTEGDHIKSVARGRGRGELGFSYGLDDNLRIGFDSFYDGIGASRYESYGLSLSAEIKF